ncbi:bifunctional glutamate N-acetyltransferase/amino-acid acetyltransferase ArgJ [Candidatus Margulisiibacteriota bacterium]
MKNITDLNGVYASGIHCGIKPKDKDLAFIYVPDAYSSAGVFTKNRFAAPCVSYTKNCLKKTTLKAVIINSGNANAATGKLGEVNNKKIAQSAAKCLGLSSSQVGVASTGIIGEQLPIELITKGVNSLLKDPLVKQGGLAAKSILTTDTRTKTVFVQKKVNNKTIYIAGMSKGVGMIAPNMATTLSFLVTNARIEKKFLQEALIEAVNNSFNIMSVDTDTSTNDMVLILSTGEEQCQISSVSERSAFKELLLEACEDFTKQIISDAEGATKFIEAKVKGAVNKKQAQIVARNIINSPLIKTSVYGGDPNWGRVVMAAGKDPNVKMDLNKTDLSFGNKQILKQGSLVPSLDIKGLKKYLKGKTIIIEVNLNIGQADAKAWGCDMSEQYIALNTEYS